MIDGHTQRMAQFGRDSSVAVPAFVFVVNGLNLGLQAAGLDTLDRLALVVKSAARKARYLQQISQSIVMPKPEDQARLVSATDLFTRIKACTFFKYATSARSRSLSSRKASVESGMAVRGGSEQGCSDFFSSVGILFSRPSEPRSARLRRQTTLIRIADVIDSSHPPARQLFTVLMGQNLQLEFRTVRAAFGAQPVDAMQSVAAHPSTDLLLGHAPAPRQQLCTAFAAQKADSDLQLELRFVVLHGTL